MADNDSHLLEEIGKLIDAKLEPVNEQLDTLHHGVIDVMQGQERLEKGQQEIRATQQEQGKKTDTLLSGQSHVETAIKTLATKQDVERVEKEVDKIKKGLRPRHAD